jgi:hypothetical protein
MTQQIRPVRRWSPLFRFPHPRERERNKAEQGGRQSGRNKEREGEGVRNGEGAHGEEGVQGSGGGLCLRAARAMTARVACSNGRAAGQLGMDQRVE